MDIPIFVGNGDIWKRTVSKIQEQVWQRQKKSASSLDESEKNGSEDTSVGGFGLCSFRNHCDDWKWNNCLKVTSTLDSGVVVSVVPTSLGDVYVMQIEEPISYKTFFCAR